MAGTTLCGCNAGREMEIDQSGGGREAAAVPLWMLRRAAFSSGSALGAKATQRSRLSRAALDISPGSCHGSGPRLPLMLRACLARRRPVPRPRPRRRPAAAGPERQLRPASAFAVRRVDDRDVQSFQRYTRAADEGMCTAPASNKLYLYFAPSAAGSEPPSSAPTSRPSTTPLLCT